jgi:hypothetical protein
VECPTCKYPVLVDGSTCRRCGAPLRVPIIEAKVPVRTALKGQRARGAGVAAPVAPPRTTTPDPYISPAARAAAYIWDAPPGTLLPGAFSRPDNLLPRATRSSTPPAAAAPAAVVRARSSAQRVPVVGARVARERALRANWRRTIITGAVALALTAGVVAAWPVLFDHAGMPPIGAAPALNDARATTLLRTVVGKARETYAARHSYTSLTPAWLSARSYNVPVVDSPAVATPGAVSLRVDGAARLTLASPAGWHRCVFARDDAAHNRTEFATARTANCRASAAPATGWSAR